MGRALKSSRSFAVPVWKVWWPSRDRDMSFRESAQQHRQESLGRGITAEDMSLVVVDVSFTEWTAGDNLRHASFEGLRDDKPPGAVARIG
jgi:ATP-dependent DNA ligase